ncbi:MAG TPA: hypothetical protein VNA69_10760 [Thermoanaerobaculia bacterium]|nr:hypothetical protein [Thermoanaerobaculia bacterium]
METFIERLREKIRLARSTRSHVITARFAIAAMTLMFGFASLRAVLLATVERHMLVSIATTVAALVSGAAIGIVTRWRRNRRERRGHRLSSEIKQVYREAIVAAGLTGGKL